MIFLFNLGRKETIFSVNSCLLALSMDCEIIIPERVGKAFTIFQCALFYKVSLLKVLCQPIRSILYVKDSLKLMLIRASGDLQNVT